MSLSDSSELSMSPPLTSSELSLSPVKVSEFPLSPPLSAGEFSMSPGTVIKSELPLSPPLTINDFDLSPTISCAMGSPPDVSERLSPPTTTTTTTSTPKLPPCRVCGERASGFHYGVNTCEACKGFFRRSLQRKDSYKCNDRGNCIIEPGKRNFCPHCRYKKCMSVGMSKTAIKTGRYTHAKRTKDIQEVKRIERLQKSGSDPASLLEKERLHQEVIAALEQARRDNPYYVPEFLEKLEERQNTFLEEFEYKRDVFGLGSSITRSEYKEFFQKTGIDIDGRRQMLSFWIPVIEMAIRKYINFAKAIPGFKELPVEDQIALIKAARFEVWMLSNFRGYHKKHDIFTGTSGQTYHITELSRVHDIEFLRCCFRLARRLQTFNLTEVEVSLMQSAVMFFTDRCTLNKRARVEELNMTMIEALEKQLKISHPNSPNMLAKLLLFLVDLREYSHLHNQEKDHLKTQMDEMSIPFPPLWLEMDMA